MPELPEVETVCRGLAPHLQSHVLAHVQTRRLDLRIPFPPRFAARLTGRRVKKLHRRAKYLLAELDNGETLVMHLGMSGRFSVHGPTASKVPIRGHNTSRKAEADGAGKAKHDHVVFENEMGTRIVYSDPRRFGLMTLIRADALESHTLFKGLGPEPLDRTFTPKILATALRTKRTTIKAALLDQRVVAGLGNIYICEALFRARISPRRTAASVSGTRATNLVRAIKHVLRAAIGAGGSTLRNYARTDGELGGFQDRFAVYGREGAPCPTKGCEGTIKRIVQAGRSTWYCPSCQH